MNNKHWQYVILLLIFIVLLDFAFGKLYEILYFSERSRQNDRLIHSVLGADEDIMIFGSSRALHHYNPKIIGDSLGMTCYNFGSGGQNIYFHLALLKSALERYTPKIVILELMYIDFEQTPPEWDTEKLGVLLPFAWKSAACMDAVLLKGDWEQVKLQSRIYPYNSLPYKILRNNILPYHNYTDGFIPLNKTHKGDLKLKSSNKQNIDKGKIVALNHFVELCQINKIELWVFVSPHYVLNENRESVYKEVSEHLHEKFSLTVQNLESNKFFIEHADYFSDPFHLNGKGAEIYSLLIVKKLQEVTP